jgi:hypothetical protein
MTAESCSVAISRSRPPQCGHARISIASARCINPAQLQTREPRFAVAPTASGAVEAVGSAATRPYATTRASHRKSSARNSARASYEWSGVI